MDNHAPPFMLRDRLFVGPGPYHHNGPNALQWATFALVLLLVLSYFATMVSTWATRRAVTPARPATPEEESPPA
jgi:hypothetical protein